MSASAVQNLRTIPRSVTVRVPRSTERVLSFFADVTADRRQLLYALTLSEYLEAWLAPPDADGQEQPSVTRSGSAYAIDYRDAHGQTLNIRGLFRTATRDKVIFTFSKCWPKQTRQSLASIRLSGNFARTSLIVKHAGAMPDEEYWWLHDFWDLSLTRLKSLFAPAATRAFLDCTIR